MTTSNELTSAILEIARRKNIVINSKQARQIADEHFVKIQKAMSEAAEDAVDELVESYWLDREESFLISQLG